MKNIFAVIQIICIALFLFNIPNIVKAIKKKNEVEIAGYSAMSLLLVMIGAASYFLGK